MAGRSSCVAALLACAGLQTGQAAVAGSPQDGARLGIVVCDAASVPAATLATAQLTAGSVFAKAGVSVEWLGCAEGVVENVKDVADGISCHRPRHPRWFVLEILPQAPSGAGFSTVVGGFARVPRDGQRGDCAVVFYGRALDTARFEDVYPGQLLAHLIAHEMGHLLLGARSHSGRGIMRPAWSRTDIARIARGQLTFEPGEMERLRDGAVREAHDAPPREVACPTPRARLGGRESRQHRLIFCSSRAKRGSALRGSRCA